MSEWMLWLESQFNTNPQFYRNLMLSLTILVGLWLLWRWVLHLEARRIADTRARYQWRKTTTYVFYITIAIVLVFIWLGDIANLATYLVLVVNRYLE